MGCRAVPSPNFDFSYFYFSSFFLFDLDFFPFRRLPSRIAPLWVGRQRFAMSTLSSANHVLLPALRDIALSTCLSVRDVCAMWGACQSWKEELDPIFRLLYMRRNAQVAGSGSDRKDSDQCGVTEATTAERPSSWYRHQLALEDIFLPNPLSKSNDDFRCIFVDANWDCARYDRFVGGCNCVVWGHTLLFPVPCSSAHLDAALPSLFSKVYPRKTKNRDKYGHLVRVTPASAFRRIGHSILKSKKGYDEALYRQKVLLLKDLCRYLEEMEFINVTGVGQVLDVVLGQHGQVSMKGLIPEGATFRVTPAFSSRDLGETSDDNSRMVVIEMREFVHDIETCPLDPSDYFERRKVAEEEEWGEMKGVLPIVKGVYNEYHLTRREIENSADLDLAAGDEEKGSGELGDEKRGSGTDGMGKRKKESNADASWKEGGREAGLHVYILESFQMCDQVNFLSQEEDIKSLSSAGITFSDGTFIPCLAYMGSETGAFKCNVAAKYGMSQCHASTRLQFPVIIFGRSRRMIIEGVRGQLDSPATSIIEYRELKDGIDYNFPVVSTGTSDAEAGRHLAFYADDLDEDWLSPKWTRHIIIVDHNTRRGWGMSWGWSS